MLGKSNAVALTRACLLLLLIGYVNVQAQTPPPGFASVMVSNQWNEAVGLTFTNDGTIMFVWERGGRVYTVTNGNRRLILDISDEVGAWHDHGLLGFALDPHFDENGYIYLLYVVDRHHLMNYGTALYNPGANEYFTATIGRLTRFTAVSDLNGVYSVNPASRKILIGETKSTGIPIVTLSHGVGSLVFGTDHTLLVSTGDAATPSTYDNGSIPASSASYFAQALADNIISDKENVGAFRSQLVDCLNGKILRIDPETGNGIPSNPFYDPARPDRPSSKVWAQGFRNPFRMVLEPGTGSHSPQDGNPGILYLGDVGWLTFEELNKIDGPGQNFGWPIYEGLTALGYAQLLTPNKDAPNPLYQIGGCSQQFFNFQDLIKQATPSGTSTFPNTCNTSQNIPSSIPTFVHKRPMIDWHHGAGPSRTGIFIGQSAAEVNIGAAGSPVAGPQFGGNAAIAGVFYTGTDFPPEFQNTFFFGDYTGGWIKNLTLNENNQPVEVKNFVDNNAIVVCMATHPTSGGLYYANFPFEIRRIIYTSNQPPLAVATADKAFGASPLGIQFTGDQSSDPEDGLLTYEWNFGDGSPLSNTANPSHTFIKGDGTPGMFTVTLKVTDPAGAEDVTSLVISINNTPPEVEITSPLNDSFYPLTGETLYLLRATVDDLEHTPSQLTYRWQTTLHHESHIHPEPPDNLPETSTSLAPVGCDGETYFYSITLTVTDAAGASTTKEVRLYPDCSGIVKVDPLITWSNPAAITQGTALGFTQLNATASYNGTPVAGSFDYTPASGTVLGLGSGQQLSVTFTPVNTVLYNTASKTVTIDVVEPPPTAFYRALNLNGAALTIDGNSWQSSIGAADFSYTASGGVFSGQSIPLVPPTDVNRATMIRSSIWGNTVNLNMTAVPSGSYLVYLYVWEDNFTQTYSIFLEGSVVLSNFVSGGAGVWTKLGPYPLTITDGAINVSANGGHALLSGIEVWTAGPPQPDQPPVVANPIVDQNATPGLAFNYTFPANTFSDPNPGTTLTYTATLQGGAALPGWLTFTGSTRTFSGTPLLANLGTINIAVTASDGTPGGTVTDVFALTVGEAPPPATFYRALNLNGAALTIDGNSWQSSIGAANFSFTASGGVFSGQSIPLVPSTDANRATMIRSSIWGNTVNLNMTAVPSGSYQVWLYVWEDNASQIYSVSLEGSVVLSNFASGGAGVWTKLGPYPVTITDGAINVSTNGGHADVSGLEVWTAGTPPPNQPPVVANPIVDQNASAGLPFNYTFPANTFSDPNAGTTLTYSATLNGGGALPGWLTFTGSTRTFSGTPLLANLGTINIAVTASDGTPGGTVTDVFALTVGEAPPPATFYRALNLNGAALTIDGNSWQSSIGAANFSFTASGGVFSGQSIPLVPSTDANRATMIRSSIWGNTVNLNMTAVPSGSYQVWLYVWEDNASQIYSVSLEGSVVLSNFASGGAGVWTKLGPYPVTITDGAINVSTNGGHADVSGLEVWTAGTPPPNQPPVVANPIVDQNASAGLPFNYTFPANTFSDPNAGTTLTYSATLNGGGALPGWLTFTGSTRTFSGTPLLANLGTINIAVTASDGAPAGTVTDVFALTVGEAPPPSGFYRALNLNGAALTIDGNSWQSSIGAADFSYTASGGVFSGQTIPLVPSTDANRTTMIRSSIWGNTVNLNMTAVPTGSYQVWLYVWEDNFSQTYSVSIEGSVVRSNFVSGGAGTWTKLGPYPVTITDGAINVSTNGGHADVSGLEVWTGSTDGGGSTTARASVATLEVATYDSAALKAYPNPFGKQLTVRYTARQSGNARVELFDVRGIRIHLIHDEKMSAGETKQKELDTSTMPDGIYILQFANGKHIFRLKLMGIR